jgi:hypothetical protein
MDNDLREIKGDIKNLIASQQQLALGQAVIVAQYAASERATEQHRESIQTKLDGLATKAEVKDIRDDLDELAAEYKGDKTWITRSIWGAWIAGAGVVWGLMTKKFS